MNIQTLSNKVYSAFHQRKLRRNLQLIVSVLFPVMVIFCTPIIIQTAHDNGIATVLWWLRRFRGAYYANVLVLGCLYLPVYLLCNSTFRAAIAILGLSFIFTMTDLQKMHILNQPLLPGDLLFIRQALYVAKLYAMPLLSSLLLFILAVILLLRVKKKVHHFPIPVGVRVASGCLFITGCIFVYGNFTMVIDSLNRHFSICNEYWNQPGNYRKNGVLYSFAMNLASITIQKPQSYNRKTMETFFSRLPENSTSGKQRRPSPPDVIIVLSESFWDITEILPKPLPCDPICHFHELCKTNPSIKLLSPTMGGNTCIAEFEVLTGMPHSFFPPGVIAYNQFITRPVPSLVQVFRENGYRATGIHTFMPWFWNRENVYRQFGFDAFLSEKTMNRPEFKGKFISDRELSRQIIAAVSQKEQPDFIFALSMQNHGPYSLRRYDTLDCPAVTGLSTEATMEVNTFVQGLIDADHSLELLTHYVDTTETPTFLFFFGDHLPGFTHIYKETGYHDKIHRDTIWSHTTSSVWYANFPLEPFPDSIISMFFLPLYIAKQAGIATPVYYRFLDAVRIRQPLFRLPAENGSKADSTAEFFRMCVYDALFGKKYADRFHRTARLPE